MGFILWIETAVRLLEIPSFINAKLGYIEGVIVFERLLFMFFNLINLVENEVHHRFGEGNMRDCVGGQIKSENVQFLKFFYLEQNYSFI